LLTIGNIDTVKEPCDYPYVNSPTLSVPGRRTRIKEYGARPLSDDREDFVEAPPNPTGAARGAVTGVVLDAVLWGAILVLVGMIKS
jgi:hypothetical protein